MAHKHKPHALGLKQSQKKNTDKEKKTSELPSHEHRPYSSAPKRSLENR